VNSQNLIGSLLQVLVPYAKCCGVYVRPKPCSVQPQTGPLSPAIAISAVISEGSSTDCGRLALCRQDVLTIEDPLEELLYQYRVRQARYTVDTWYP
jgi:hypothetical protein